MKIHIRCLL